MILLIDLCYREGSLGFDEYVLPVARIAERSGFEVRSVHFRAVTAKDLSGAEAVILCGTPLADNAFLDEPGAFSWMRTSRIPILGVCAGMEMVCRIFGGIIGPCTEIGMTEIRVTGTNPFFPAFSTFSGYELHTLACIDPGPLDVIAISDCCIQAVRRPGRPYGVMFHPEVRNEWVVERFLTMTRKDEISLPWNSIRAGRRSRSGLTRSRTAGGRGCFTTPNFNADPVRVFFVLLVYTLIELYLKATHHEGLAIQTIDTLKQEERLGKDAVIVYAEKYFGVFDVDESFEIILDLKARPRERLRRWIKKFRKEKIRSP